MKIWDCRSRAEVRSSVGFDREIARESEALPIEPGGHQGQHQRGGSDVRDDFHAPLVRQFHQPGAGIGHGGQAGFRHQGGVFRAEPQGVAFNGRGIRVLVDLEQFQGIDAAFQARSRQEAPGRPQLFHEEKPDRLETFQHRGRKRITRFRGAEGCRDQMEFAGHHRL